MLLRLWHVLRCWTRRVDPDSRLLACTCAYTTCCSGHYPLSGPKSQIPLPELESVGDCCASANVAALTMVRSSSRSLGGNQLNEKVGILSVLPDEPSILIRGCTEANRGSVYPRNRPRQLLRWALKSVMSSLARSSHSSNVRGAKS